MAILQYPLVVNSLGTGSNSSNLDNKTRIVKLQVEEALKNDVIYR